MSIDKPLLYERLRQRVYAKPNITNKKYLRILETNLIKGVYWFVVIVLQAPYVAEQKKQMLNSVYKMMDEKKDSFGFSGTDFLPCLPSLASSDATINIVKISIRKEPKSKRFRSICLSKPHFRQTYLLGLCVSCAKGQWLLSQSWGQSFWNII